MQPIIIFISSFNVNTCRLHLQMSARLLEYLLAFTEPDLNVQGHNNSVKFDNQFDLSHRLFTPESQHLPPKWACFSNVVYFIGMDERGTQIAASIRQVTINYFQRAVVMINELMLHFVIPWLL